MTEIIPSILVKTKEEFLEKIIAIEPYASQAHIDIADGIFVPNMTIDGIEEVEEVETSLQFGVHLMVSKPENHIQRWLQTPAEKFAFHIEATQKAAEIINAVKEAEKLAGIALNPGTPVSAIEPYIEQVDFVHFLTVEPGFGGQEFILDCLPKVEEVRKIFKKDIEVDGGINELVSADIIRKGANIIVAGTSVFGSKNYAEAIKKLRGGM